MLPANAQEETMHCLESQTREGRTGKLNAGFSFWHASSEGIYSTGFQVLKLEIDLGEVTWK